MPLMQWEEEEEDDEDEEDDDDEKEEKIETKTEWFKADTYISFVSFHLKWLF